MSTTGAVFSSWRALGWMLVLWGTLAVTGCGGDADPSTPELDVTPGTVMLAKGRSAAVTATVDGTAARPGQVSWRALPASVATVAEAADGTVTITGVAEGQAVVSASLDGAVANVVVTVEAAAIEAIAITPATPSLAAGTELSLLATATLSDRTTRDLTAQVQWRSEDVARATITSIGRLRGIAKGTARVTATLGAMSAATVATVTDATLLSIAVTPAGASVAKGLTQQMTATGTFSDATRQDLTSMVTWASNATTQATVTSGGLVTGRALGAATISATLGAVSGQTSINVTAAVLQSVAVTPAAPSLAKGLTLSLTATGTYSDTTTADLSATATWTSSNLAVATVNGRVVTAVAVGDATISATMGGISGTTALTVTPAALVSVAVTPAAPSLAKGLTLSMTATGTYTDTTTADLSATATWTSSNLAVATVNGRVVAAVAVGTATISATMSGITGSTVLTVTPAVLVSVAVTPATVALAKGLTLSLTATGTYTDATTADLSATATWLSSNLAVATVNGRVVTAVDAGNATISATMGGVTGTAALEVTAATLLSLAVTPADPTLAKGLTRQLTATGTFSDGSTQDLTTSATWTSSDPAHVTVSNVAGTRGVATAVAVGPSTVTAAVSAISGSTTVTVTAAQLTSIAVAPATFSLAAGRTQQLVATATFTDASTQDVTTQAVWSSSAPAAATVSNTAGEQGLVRALAAGTATLTAALGGISGSATATITGAVLVSISVTPATATLAVGATLQFTATGTYSDSSTQAITTQVTWTSSNGTVAQVSNASGSNGLATARAGGTVTITATLASVNGTASLTVSSTAPTKIRLMAANITSGNLQSYDPGPGTRIFQGLHPDVVMIQEFNYRPSNTDADIRAWVDTTFGTNYSFYREVGKNIPNGVISRYPILAAGTWEDTAAPDREFVWARLDVPGAKDLWAISVHLLTRDAPTRNGEAGALRDLINANIPAADYLVIGGDFNTDSRGEACISTFSAVVSTGSPYPADQAGLQGTNASRGKPYDWVLMDSDLRAFQTSVVIGTSSFAGGLVFDSRVYSPLADVAPVLQTDSGAVNMQHMGVVVDVQLP